MVRLELLATAQSIVPVYPSTGVAVTVEVPEEPAVTLTFVADTVKEELALVVDGIVRVMVAVDPAQMESPE